MLVGACGLLLSTPAGALAGRADIDVDSYVDRGGETVFTAELQYVATPGEANRLHLTFVDEGVIVSDAAGVTAGRGCIRIDADSSRCSGPAADPRAPEPDSARVRLGDAADRVEVGGSVAAGATLAGGRGRRRPDGPPRRLCVVPRRGRPRRDDGREV